jgi:hypothetical protein
MCTCPQKPKIFSLILLLNPLTVAVAIIITVILNAIAAMAMRIIILENDFFDVTPTLRAM